MPRTKYPTTPNPVGRPPIYRADFPGLAHKFCLLGCDNKKLGEMFGVEETTIYHWLKTYPLFFEAVHAGRDLADAEVANSLYQKAKGYRVPAVKIFCNPTTGDQELIEYDEYHAPDTTAIKYWLGNRQRKTGAWMEKQTTELTGPGGEPLFADKAQQDEQARQTRAAMLAELT